MTTVFEDLPIMLSQEEKRTLAWIVGPASTKRQARRKLILAIVVMVVVMPGMVCGSFYVPMGDLSKYESFADAGFAVLAIGVFVSFGYLVVKQTKLRDELIKKLYHALSSMDKAEADIKTTESPR